MKKFEEIKTSELEKARGRVFRLYGQQKITREQHDVSLGLLNLLNLTLTDQTVAVRLSKLNLAETLEKNGATKFHRECTEEGETVYATNKTGD